MLESSCELQKEFSTKFDTFSQETNAVVGKLNAQRKQSVSPDMIMSSLLLVSVLEVKQLNFTQVIRGYQQEANAKDERVQLLEDKVQRLQAELDQTLLEHESSNLKLTRNELELEKTEIQKRD